jgi:hypothetical protein
LKASWAISLNEFEREIARHLGAFMDERGRQMKGHWHGRDIENRDIHGFGLAGELAFCKLAGIYWNPTINTFHERPDIEPDVQIRTAREHTHKLIVRKDDLQHHRHHRFVLVTTDEDKVLYVVRGWIQGWEAEVAAWWGDGTRKFIGDAPEGGWRPWDDPKRCKPAYFVPQGALRSMEEFRWGLSRESPRTS